MTTPKKPIKVDSSDNRESETYNYFCRLGRFFFFGRLGRLEAEKSQKGLRRFRGRTILID